MCWNSDISLNTFLFACLALTFIFIANTFTKYKSSAFDNPLVYLFLFEVASIQLIEFFLWRNLKNKNVNETLSYIASHVIVLQVMTLILMIKNTNIKYAFLIILALTYMCVYSYVVTFTENIKFYTSIGKNGHLVWEWMNFKGIENIFLVIFLLLYVIPVLLIDNAILATFILISLFISLIFYYKYKTFGTMWCWLTNIFLLYFISDILLIQPFYEYNGLC